MSKFDRIIEQCILTFIFFLPIFIPISLIALLIAVILSIAENLKRKEILAYRPRAFLFSLLGLVFCVALSVAFSTDKLRSLGNFIVFLAYPLVTILLISVIDKERQSAPLAIGRAIIISAIIVTAFALFQWITKHEINIKFTLFSFPVTISGPTITFHRLNRVARYLVLVLPLGLGVFLNEKTLKWKLLAIVSILMGITVMFATRSLAGVGIIIILSLLFISIKNWKVGLILFLALCIFAIIKPNDVKSFANRRSSLRSLKIRIDTWKEIVVPIFKDYPITGCGLGNYTPVSWQYRGRGFLHSHAHSLYFHYLAETGALGVTSLLCVIIIFFRVCLPKIRASPIALGCALSITGILIHGTVETIFEFLPIGLLFWTIIGIGISHAQKNSLSITAR